MSEAHVLQELLDVCYSTVLFHGSLDGRIADQDFFNCLKKLLVLQCLFL